MIVYANGKLIATDSEGNTQPIAAVGEKQDTLKIADDEVRELLCNIITELKILNIYMSDITDNHIEENDVEV